MNLYVWWLVQSYLIDGMGLVLWFFGNFFHTRWKILFSRTWGEIEPCEVRLKRTLENSEKSEKSKIPFWVEGTFWWLYFISLPSLGTVQHGQSINILQVPECKKIVNTLGKIRKTQNSFLGGGDIWWLYLISLPSSGTVQHGQSINILQVPECKKIVYSWKNQKNSKFLLRWRGHLVMIFDQFTLFR